VELVVPFSPGGGTDLIGRAIARAIEEPLGEPMVVVNREGANGAVGSREVINSAPDGYRLAITSASLFTVTPLLVENADNISLDDLRLIKNLTVENLVMLANADGPYQTLDDLIAAGEAGETISFSHSGAGGVNQFSQLWFFGQAGIKAIDVPFDGAAPALTALLGNQVDISTSEIAASAEQVEAGDVVRLGVFSAERSSLIPEVPTMKEQGFDIQVNAPRPIFGPRDMPDDVVNKLSDALQQVSESEEFEQFLEDNYVEKQVQDAEELRRFLEETRERYAAVIEEQGIERQEAS
jgi:tripartite-type tricarboxylate transporter receptor subunit TctC